MKTLSVSGTIGDRINLPKNKPALGALRTYIVCSCLFVAGCTYQIISSERVDEAANTGRAEPGGLIYSLPETLVKVSASQAATGAVTYVVTASITPDPRERYRLRFAPSAQTDNTIDLKVDANGLLTSATANINDRSGDIVVAVASFAASLAPSPGTRWQIAAPPEPAVAYPFDQYISFDRLANGEVVKLWDGATLSIDTESLKAWPVSKVPDHPINCSYSVCYRSVIPVVATISGGEQKKDKTQFYFPAIDKTRTEGIDIHSASLVNRTHTLEFANGVMTRVNIVQPSTNLALAQLPLQVIQAVMKSLFTLNISYANAEQNALAAQTNLLTAIQALHAAQGKTAATQPSN